MKHDSLVYTLLYSLLLYIINTCRMSMVRMLSNLCRVDKMVEHVHITLARSSCLRHSLHVQGSVPVLTFFMPYVVKDPCYRVDRRQDALRHPRPYRLSLESGERKRNIRYSYIHVTTASVTSTARSRRHHGNSPS